MVIAFEDWDEKKVHLVYGPIKQLNIQGQRDEFYPIGLVALWEASVRYEEGKDEFDSFAYSYILKLINQLEAVNERAIFHQELKNVYHYPDWEDIARLLDLDYQLIIRLEKRSDQLKSYAIT